MSESKLEERNEVRKRLKYSDKNEEHYLDEELAEDLAKFVNI
jgi:hypothetical protein